MKKIINMILFVTALATASMLSCNSPDLVPEAPMTLEYSIIDGDTVKNRVENNFQQIKEKDKYRKIQISVGDTIVTYRKPTFNKPKRKADLSNLKNDKDPTLKGKPLKYMAIGGSYAAGVRDGGYFNEGAETSYPNIIANQMDLQDFKQPYFNASDFNGYGRKALTKYNPTGGPVPKFKDVVNNNGVEKVDETGIVLKKNNGEWDNLAFQNMSIGSLNGGDIYLAENGTYPEDKLDAQFYRRLFPKESKEGLVKSIFEDKYDFISIDFGGLYKSGSSVVLMGPKSQFNQDDFIFSENEILAGSPDDFNRALEVRFFQNYNKTSGIGKGIIFNYPNFMRAPYFNFITDEKIKYALGGQKIYAEQFGSYESFKGELQLLPTSEVDSMLSPTINISLKKGVSVNKPLSFRSVIGHPVRGSQAYQDYNKMINSLGKRYNLPVVDLYSLFEKVAKGEYITHDGIKADPAWITGNFYSSDGIFPSAFGQAIIANEAIRTINAYYKTDIPLADTRPFLEIK
jgi:hypothetical protein